MKSINTTYPSIPSTSIREWYPIPSEGSQFSAAFIQHSRSILLQAKGKDLVIGQVAPVKSLAYWESFYPHFSISLYEIEESDFLSFYKRSVSGVVSIQASNGDDENGWEKDQLNVESQDSHSPVIDLVDGLLIEALRRKASDIHIESQGGEGHLRYRQDGVLVHGERIPPDKVQAVLNRIKVLSKMNLMESRLPQEGRLSLTLGGVEKDIRLSYVPTLKGYSLVLRILGEDHNALSLQKLGFSPFMQSSLREISRHNHGLFLCCGPTGSGKTTTIHALIRQFPLASLKVISVEDPVEYKMDQINQIQVHEEIGLTYATILKRVLRQDPDVLIIGEIRDEDTAQLAIRAALTGHLVISSLHTIDSVSAIDRLLNLGVPDDLIQTLLIGVMSQRLVRTYCPSCHGEGCLDCFQTGFKGRRPICELLLPSDKRWLKRPDDQLIRSFKEDASEVISQEYSSQNEVDALGVLI